MKTDMGPLGVFDFLTKDELSEALNSSVGHRIDHAIREWYRGIDSARFPRMIATASAVGALNLGVGPGEGMCGPAQGDVWMVRRMIVKASVLTDPATYVAFRGTSPSDPNAYSAFNILDAFTAKGGGLPVNMGFYPSTKSVLLQPGEQIYAQVLTPTVGVTYLLEGEAIRVPAEMKGKVLS
jgi:hypothetical protein